MDAFTVLFIGSVIIALTEVVRRIWPTVVTGALTIVVALLVGVFTAVFSDVLGISHLSIANGILIALGAVGVHTTAKATNSTN